MKIKKGDRVKIITGKDKGKIGKVEKVIRAKGKALVDGVNVYRKHLKPRGEKNPGGIVDISKPIDVSNVVLICPNCNKPTKIGYAIDKKGGKTRICKKCKKGIK
jgi:large subunit ribosomal protein L24